MSDFIKTTDGNYLNRAHVARFVKVTGGEVYRAEGANGETLGCVNMLSEDIEDTDPALHNSRFYRHCNYLSLLRWR